ncbi:MAG: hypothetical protein N0C84_22585 [Candidatus Thiodiazotropha taylori]|uniref:Uncharacterized protein n=1 Tax=Candidatus Thiodiazotropha taylori TaxID=2792791 RepID=A0A9E4TB66_9GAMM|nr:hypothetical protein [Candidatus Thiodiazotropha taylori]MCW4259256.1 hypothetical protein [Candidatus Thiodiazotropha taylori]
MADDLYPSPLRIRTKYKGKLVKKRPYSEPPRSGEEFPTAKLRGLASNDYDAEIHDYAEQQMQLDLEGMRLLADHYGVDVNIGDEFWMRIALHLARDHVPWFQMDGKRGRPTKWNEQEYALLQLRVIEKQSEGLTIERALEEIACTHYPTLRGGLKRRYEEAQQLSNSDGARYSTRELQQIKQLPTDLIKKIRSNVEILCDQITSEDDLWLKK